MKTEKELALIAIKGHESVSYVTKGEYEAMKYIVKRLRKKGFSEETIKKIVGIAMEEK